MSATTAGHSFKIAAVQAAPVFLNREATLDKACQLIEEAGRNAARLVVFTESFIPAYPDWVWAVPAGEEGCTVSYMLNCWPMRSRSPARRRNGCVRQPNGLACT